MARQIDINEIRPHAEVIGSDHQHVGKVDHLEGSNQLKLERHDSAADNVHHLIPLDWIDSISNGKVVLNKSAADAKKQWRAI